MNIARKQGGAGKILPNDAMGVGVGVDDVAGDLRDLIQGRLVGVVGEGGNVFLTRLLFQNREINATSCHTGRGARFKAHKGETRLAQGVRKPFRPHQPVRACRVGHVTHEDGRGKVSTGAKNDLFGLPHVTQRGLDACDPLAILGVLGEDLGHVGLDEAQTLGFFHRGFHNGAV